MAKKPTEESIIKKNKEIERKLNKKMSKIIEKHGVESLFRFLGGSDYIHNIATALTNYAFREGPIEDMHAGIDPKNAPAETDPKHISQLSQEDMMTLNKHMVDKLAFFLTLIAEKRYVELNHLMRHHIQETDDWDHPNLAKEEQEWQKLWEIVLSDEDYFASPSNRKKQE